MIEHSYDEAWAEAAASNRRNAGRIATLEFLHAGITAEGKMVPVRAASTRKPVMLRLEPEAPLDPGDLVEFRPLGFSSSLPERSANGSLVSRVSISNIGGSLWQYVEAGVDMRTDAVLILREYLRNNPNVVAAGPFRLVVREVTMANGAIEGECTLDTLSDVMVPKLKYTADRFANLNG